VSTSTRPAVPADGTVPADRAVPPDGTAPDRADPAVAPPPGARLAAALPGRVLRTPSEALAVRWRPRAVVVGSVLALVLVGLGVLAMTKGSSALTPGEVVTALLGDGDRKATKIVLGIRLPRVVTGVLVGAALGVAGAVFQSLSRNVLGSPDVIGFTTGAATGAVVQIVVLEGGPLAIALSAVVSGLACAVVVYLLALRGSRSGGYRLILVGIGVGAILSAVNGLLLTRGGLDQAVEAQVWLAGSLAGRTWTHAAPLALAVALLLPPVVWLGRRLAYLELGDDAATQLGVRVERTRLALMVLGVGLTGVAIAAAGPISFVALAAPQLARRLTRAPAPPVVGSALMGAALLVAADLLSQHLPLGLAMPVGLMTGLLGGIYLAWLLTRTKKA